MRGPRRGGGDPAARRHGAARAATAGQAVRRLLGISGRQARGRRIARACARRASSHEELGITVRTASPWMVQEFSLPARARRAQLLSRVTTRTGEPAGHDGQSFAWQDPGRVSVAPLLPPIRACWPRSTLPTVYADHVRNRRGHRPVRRACATRDRGGRAADPGARARSCAARCATSGGFREARPARPPGSSSTAASTTRDGSDAPACTGPRGG